MSRNRKYRYFACDFETTVYDGQKDTEVWSSAIIELYTDKPIVLHSIEETFAFFKNLKSNVIAYYHNLKFDGSFWVNYFLTKTKLTQAVERTGVNEYDLTFKQPKDMENNTFGYNISDKGKWFSVYWKINNYVIELRDSVKLLPFSLKSIARSFNTQHDKLDMEYKGFRYAGCDISNEEMKYIENDVFVLKEALEIMFDEGHNKITIGSCCLAEYKDIVGKAFYDEYLPDLTKLYIQPSKHRYDNVDAWIRKSYKGGWCYLVKGKENVVFNNGVTADVNSLYPSMMHSESGNYYPVGEPKFWTGGDIPQCCFTDDYYYFIRVKTRFYIKHGMLPFVQIKGSYLYKSTEVLESSDIYDKRQKRYVSYYTDFEGNICDTRVEMTFTQTEYVLFLEHYDVVDFEILDGCYFVSSRGIFDEYIDKYKKIKTTSKGAKRTLAKLFLNNLYGKMASSTDSSFKYCYLKDDGALGYVGITANEKKAGYIAVGSAITGYARNFTIRHAQKNFYGADKPGFVYADTDSIHCDFSADNLIGLNVHPTDFNCWSIESYWDEAIFVRQKTYIEHVTHEDGDPVTPYYNVKCAGMQDRCKKLLVASMTDNELIKEADTKEKIDFIKTRRTIKDFKVGLRVPGKLSPKQIKGGTLLVEGYYELRR